MIMTAGTPCSQEDFEVSLARPYEECSSDRVFSWCPESTIKLGNLKGKWESNPHASHGFPCPSRQAHPYAVTLGKTCG